MQLIISGRGVVLSPSFKALVARKLDRLERVLPRIDEARVTCGAEKFRRTVRVTVRARRRLLSAAVTADDLLLAADAAVAALGRQAREEKDRLRLGQRRTVRGTRVA